MPSTSSSTSAHPSTDQSCAQNQANVWKKEDYIIELCFECNKKYTMISPKFLFNVLSKNNLTKVYVLSYFLLK